MTKPTPNFHPIGMLPTIAELITGDLDAAEGQLALLTEGRSKPHVLDDGILDRVKKLYEDVGEMTDVYGEQLERWKRDLAPTGSQREQVEGLVPKVIRLRACCTEILALERQLRQGSINRILEMSDMEAGLAFLTGQIKSPR